MDMVFDVFWRDEKTGHVEIKNNTLVRNECYTEDLIKCACGRIKDYLGMVSYMETRIMCKERWTPEMLDSIGLKEYNLFEIFRRMHGIDIDDFTWFRFEGEDLTWDDVKVRD